MTGTASARAAASPRGAGARSRRGELQARAWSRRSSEVVRFQPAAKFFPVRVRTKCGNDLAAVEDEVLRNLLRVDRMPDHPVPMRQTTMASHNSIPTGPGCVLRHVVPADTLRDHVRS